MKKLFLLLIVFIRIHAVAQTKTDSLDLGTFEKNLQLYYDKCFTQYQKIDSALSVIELTQKRFESLSVKDSTRSMEVLRSIMAGLTSIPPPYDVDRKEFKKYQILLGTGVSGPQYEACVSILKNIKDLHNSSHVKMQDRVAVIGLFLTTIR